MEINKNKVLILSIAFVALVLAPGAKAIVFIPPVIYVATLSIGSFIINFCLFLAAWLAAKGIIDREYFGKAAHEIVRLILGLLGKFAIATLSAAVSILAFNPLSREDIVFSSMAAGISSSFLLFLSFFRRYRLAQKNEKLSYAKSTLLFLVLVALATFASASLALETKILRMRDDGKQSGFKSANAPADAFGFSLSPKKEKAAEFKENTPYGDYQSKNEELSSREAWFYPVSFDACEIYFNNSRILAAYPSRNCYFYNNNGQPVKILCPISVSVSQIPLNASGNLYGKGSCTENYSVSASKDGFSISE